MILSMRRILAFVMLLTSVLLIQAKNKSPIQVNISAVERTKDLWRAYVAIANSSTQPVSINISAIVTDSKGSQYRMESWTRAPIVVAPAGMKISTTSEGNTQLVELGLPAGGATAVPAILRLTFKIPADIRPARLELYPGGPRSDLSNVATLPLLSQPRISVVQSPGLTLSVGKAVRSRESGTSERATSSSGLATALQSIDSSFASKITEEMLTDFSISTGDVWLLVTLTWKNAGNTAVDIRLEDHIAVPKVPKEGTGSYSPVGIAQAGTVLLGSPFSKNISVAAGATASAILIYRPELWMEEFVLQRKSAQ